MATSRSFSVAGSVCAFALLMLASFASSPLRAAVPSRPGALRYDVYSDTAAELFWDRSSNDEIVVAYEIAIDGVVVATVDALSYFTDALTPGLYYTVDVTAIDSGADRSAPASVSFVGGDRTSVLDGRPAPPEGLRAAVYSYSAFELFWDRVPGAILSYEVSLDGQWVATTDGTSWFVDGSPVGPQYRADAVAVDAVGLRSGAATVLVTPNGGRVAPVEPQNARLAVYSSSAAELFWDRPPADAAIDTTEVRRDGALLGPTNGTSFFDDTRAPGRTYRYELVAVSANGSRSEPAVVQESGDDGRAATPMITMDNYVELLRHVFDVYTGNAYFEMVATLPDWSDPDYAGISSPTGPPPAGQSPYDPIEAVYDCANSGMAVMAYQLFYIDAELDFTFDNCLDGDALLDGQLVRYAGGSGYGRVTATNLSIVDPERRVLLTTGEGGISDSEFYDVTRSASIDELSLETADSSWMLTDVETHFSGGSITYAMNGRFTARADWTDDRLLYADADLGTTAAGIGRYDTGSLALSAQDGSRLRLNAANGDPDSVAIEILASDGSLETVTQPWSLWSEDFRYERVLAPTWYAD